MNRTQTTNKYGRSARVLVSKLSTGSFNWTEKCDLAITGKLCKFVMKVKYGVIQKKLCHKSGEKV